MAVETVTVAEDDAGSRLDRWLRRRCPGLTQGRVEKLLRTGQVRVDGRRAKSNQRLEAGQAVRLPPLIPEAGEVSGDDGAQAVPRPRPPVSVTVKPEDLELLNAAVLHRDADVIVLNKPAGLAVQGGSGTTRHLDGLLAALAAEDPAAWGGDDGAPPRLVHRLDKDTSGVLVLARSAAAARALTEAFRTRDTIKVYWALVVGLPPLPRGTIRAALAKAPGTRGERMGVDEEAGRRAVTDFRVVDQVGKACAWIELKPRTGRTHQLRVHCLEMGTPILGDGKYGARAAFLEGVGEDLARRLHLHARALAIPHPRGGLLTVTAPPPAHFADSLKTLGFALADAPDPFTGWEDEG